MNIKCRQFIENHFSEMVRDLAALVAIPSVKGEPEAGKPFGEGPAAALDAMLALAEKYGFHTKNHEGYVGTIDLDPSLPTTLGILCHLDVVPAGKSGWKSLPYSLFISGGKMYGRGVIDNKGPAIAVLYAMRAIKETGYPITQNVRLIVGTDEENGSSDIAYYKNKEALPPRVFTPDAEYPLINIEKGRIRGEFSTYSGFAVGNRSILSAAGGTVFNAVPESAYAIVCGFDEEELRTASLAFPKLGFEFTKEADGCTKITAKGVSAHASQPERGVNAVTGLCAYLGSLTTDDETARSFSRVSSAFPFGDNNGAGLGVAESDEESGALTAVFSILEYRDGVINGKFDCRFPVSDTAENLRQKYVSCFAKFGIRVTDTQCVEGHKVDADTDFVKTLLHIYGKTASGIAKPIAIGGGTYVHDIEGGVAFGAEFPGEVNNMHGANECFSLASFKKNTCIFTEAIEELCK
ncbi:MAG: Sapep family Mn(2+)-dependent dipeptidase [Clostridia bacterium]|nr:Sapep family Mn(2+)-dependent dipeptidase [Clostridia bacterium]